MENHMSIQIPEKQAKPFRDFVALPKDKRASFVDSIYQCAPKLIPYDLVKEVADKVDIEFDDTFKYLSVLGSLYSTRLKADEPVNVFVDDICEAGKQHFIKENDDREVDWEAFKEDLTKALQMEEPLGITAKAAEVVTEYQNVYASAKIISDIRPVFHENPKEKPKAASITHNLTISYYVGNEQKNFFVALDVNDVDYLTKVLERAKLKELTLSGLLKDNSIEWLKPLEGGHER